MHTVHVPAWFAVFALALSADYVWLANSENTHQTADKANAKYIIGLDTNNPYIPSRDETSESNRHIRMTNSTGHAFECIVPPASLDEAQATNQHGNGSLPEKMAGSVLESLSARCFYRLEDWWTYELCYQKHVRQFHREKDVLTDEYLLGVYDPDSADNDTLQGEVNGMNSGRYVKESYTEGDACDLTGGKRHTEVRYVCSEGGQESVLSIKEPSTCHYVLTVAVPGLCQLPIFRAEAELVRHIVCQPLVAPAAEGLHGDPESQRRHANVADGDLVEEDDSSKNSTDLGAS